MSAKAVRHPIFARMYARLASAYEQQGVAAHRDELLAGLQGRVLELGSGTGLNFAHYPSTVSEVVAVEPEPALRALTEAAAASASVSVRVVDAVADELPFFEDEFDAAVASLVLCSVSDPRRALEELERVLRPGGELRFYEHVLSPKPKLARLQHRLDHVWPYFAGGCHITRDTGSAIERAGFMIEQRRDFTFMPSRLAAPISPHVLGRARKRPK
jgi:ubiquinone/menaquinone biosynthesis C-methylase UbiE